MPHRLWKRAKTAVGDFFALQPMQLAAALSFSTLFSLAPLVLLAVAVGGLFFEREAVEGQVVAEIGGLVGEAGSEVVQSVLVSAADQEEGKRSLVIGIVTLLMGATIVFVQLQDALNRIWKVEAKPRNAIVGFVKERLLSLAMVFGIAFLLLVSLMVSAALSALGKYAGNPLGLMPSLLQVLDYVMSLGVVTLLFAMMFRFLPDVRIGWRDVWFGALTTALLFTAGKALIGLYLGRASVGSAYGAAGSIVVLMVWVYYAAVIVFLGAYITRLHTEKRRASVVTKRHAVPAPA
jgi:membrane protein